MCKFTYDYGTTTTVFMKVLLLDKSKEYLALPAPAAYQLGTLPEGLYAKIFQPLSQENLALHVRGFDVSARFVSTVERPQLLATVSASVLPKKKQLDSIFPKFSKLVCLGSHAVTLGLMTMIESEDDGTFFTVMRQGCDLMFSNATFGSLDELFALIEQNLNRCLLSCDRFHFFPAKAANTNMNRRI